MISSIIIPDLGATGGDVTLEEWLVETSQAVTAGQPIFVVTTDKASVEVEAFREGFIREIRVEVGQSLPVGAVVGLLADSPDEPLAQPESAAGVEPTIPPSQNQQSFTAPQPRGGRILVSPLARRIAEEEGLDLDSIRGSGAKGQILKRDVVAAVSGGDSQTAQLPAAGSRQEALSPMQRAVAELTHRSKHDAPHFYAAITIDMQSALESRRQAIEWAHKQGWSKPSINDLCIKAAALSLREFPMLNASFDGDIITTYSEINIGLVIGLEQGMLVPVIQRADQLNLYTIAAAAQRLKRQAGDGKLSASDLSGGTFTLSNLGMFGLDSFTAVLNPPQTGILALGAVQEKLIKSDGIITSIPVMTATLSVDHRVVDGISAARFMAVFKEMLENPTRLTLEAPQETSS